jgi:hypothetical protein
LSSPKEIICHVMFSEKVKGTPTASRLRKLFSKDHTNGLGTLLRADGSRTEDQKETLETLMMTHFPESLIVSETDTVQNKEPIIMDSSSAAWKRSKELFNCKKVK